MFDTIDRIIKEDPAAQSRWQVVLTYPGYQATVLYRVAHRFWQHGHRLTAALINHWARHHTGVDIHPGATIGRRLFIDHGMGVVIGETAIIGDDVTLLHGVTLGSRHAITGRRHPKIGNHVFIGANALILGPITVHSQAKIGAGSVVLKEVASGTTVAGNPAHVVRPWQQQIPAIHIYNQQPELKEGTSL